MAEQVDIDAQQTVLFVVKQLKKSLEKHHYFYERMFQEMELGEGERSIVETRSLMSSERERLSEDTRKSIIRHDEAVILDCASFVTMVARFVAGGEEVAMNSLALDENTKSTLFFSLSLAAAYISLFKVWCMQMKNGPSAAVSEEVN